MPAPGDKRSLLGLEMRLGVHAPPQKSDDIGATVGVPEAPLVLTLPGEHTPLTRAAIGG